MAKTYAFSSMIKEWQKNVSQEITAKMVKSEINRILQVANRRAENIEKSGLASPAYKALVNELQDSSKNRFTKFSIARLDLTNVSQRTKAIDIYSRALAYINNQTSSASGARKWIKTLANQNNIPFEVANNLVDLITSPQITNGAIVVNNWDSERVTNMISEYSKDYSSTVLSKKDYYAKISERIRDLMENQNKNVIDVFDL